MKLLKFKNTYNDFYSFRHIVFKWDVLSPIEWTEKLCILLWFSGIKLSTLFFTSYKVKFIIKYQ